MLPIAETAAAIAVDDEVVKQPRKWALMESTKVRRGGHSLTYSPCAVECGLRWIEFIVVDFNCPAQWY